MAADGYDFGELGRRRRMGSPIVIYDTPKCQAIKGCYLGEDNGKFLYDTLKNKVCPSLMITDVHITNEGFQYITKLLEDNPNITHLFINKSRHDFDHIHTGLLIIEMFQKKTNLRCAILDILLPNSCISRLFYDIANNEGTVLESLEISFEGLQSDGVAPNSEEYMQAIVDCCHNIQLFLENNSTVAYLRVNTYPQFPGIASAFAKGVKKNKSLKMFYLYVGLLGLLKQDVRRFARAIERNNTLKALYILSQTTMGEDETNKLFIEAMRNNSSLYCLKVGDNRGRETTICDELKTLLKVNEPMTKSANKR